MHPNDQSELLDETGPGEEPEAEETPGEAEPEVDAVVDAIAEEETALAARGTTFTLDSLLQQPKLLMEMIAARAQAWNTLRAYAIKQTSPGDWVLFKARNGNTFAHLCASGAERIAPLYGIRALNLRRSDGTPTSEPEIVEEKDGSLSAVLIADVYNPFTRQPIEGIRVARNSKEEFIGRAYTEKWDATKQKKVAVRRGNDDAILINDLKMATRTALTPKMVRVSCGLSKVPLSELEAAGIDVTQANMGAGFKAEEREGKTTATVTGPQVGRFLAKCRTAERKAKVPDGTIERKILEGAGVRKADEIPASPRELYERLCTQADEWSD